MLRLDTTMVTPGNGPRPLNGPDECCYCQQRLGTPHKADCVCVRRTVVLRATLNDGQSREYVESIPASWTVDYIRFARNEGSWCAGNLYNDLKACGVDVDWLPPENEDEERAGNCLCSLVTIEYVREATEDEDAKIA